MSHWMRVRREGAAVVSAHDENAEFNPTEEESGVKVVSPRRCSWLEAESRQLVSWCLRWKQEHLPLSRCRALATTIPREEADRSSKQLPRAFQPPGRAPWR